MVNAGNTRNGYKLYSIAKMIIVIIDSAALTVKCDMLVSSGYDPTYSDVLDQTLTNPLINHMKISPG